MIIRSDVLHQLWTGVAGLPRREDTRAFDAAMDALCPVRRQLIELACPAGGGRVMLDDAEVMPMISLGDVIAEEFDLTLPYGTLLLFVPRDEIVDDAPADRRAGAIGRACGQIISETIYRGAFPIDREVWVAGALTAACRERARSIPFGGARAREAFERALVRAVRDVVGVPGRQTGRRPDAAPEILEKLGACMAPLGRTGEAPNFDTWIETIQAATCGKCDAPSERAAAFPSPLASAPPSMPGHDATGDE